MSNSNEKTRAERAADLLSFYSVNELSESMGVTKKTVRNWIKGKTQPSDKNFKKVYRREYYWTKGERAKTVKQSRGIEGNEVLDGAEVWDFIRRLENDDVDLSGLSGNRFIDFKFDVDEQRDDGQLTEFMYTFSNPNSGNVNRQELISFAYRVFNSLTRDKGKDSDTAVFLQQAIV